MGGNKSASYNESQTSVNLKYDLILERFSFWQNQIEKYSSTLKLLFVFIVGNGKLHKHFYCIDNAIHKFFSFMKQSVSPTQYHNINAAHEVNFLYRL